MVGGDGIHKYEYDQFDSFLLKYIFPIKHITEFGWVDPHYSSRIILKSISSHFRSHSI